MFFFVMVYHSESPVSWDSNVCFFFPYRVLSQETTLKNLLTPFWITYQHQIKFVLHPFYLMIDIIFAVHILFFVVNL